MNDNTAEVRIVANAAGVKPGVEVAKSEVEGLAPLLQQLNAQFAELSAEIRTSMMQGAKGAAEMKQEMRLWKKKRIARRSASAKWRCRSTRAWRASTSSSSA